MHTIRSAGRPVPGGSAVSEPCRSHPSGDRARAGPRRAAHRGPHRHAGAGAVDGVGALLSGSLALLADAGHMLTDVAGLSLALIAAVLAGRPATDARTWGYRRAEVLAAAAQAAVLLAVGVFVLVEGVRRLIEAPQVASGVMVVFGVVGLLGNAVSILLLARIQVGNLNTRAALLLPLSRSPAGPARTRSRRC